MLATIYGYEDDDSAFDSIYIDFILVIVVFFSRIRL